MSKKNVCEALTMRIIQKEKETSMNYKRIFVIVMDSLGIGASHDAEKYNDQGSDTFGHIAQAMPLSIPESSAVGHQQSSSA
jgi:phosphopentomutase